MKARKHIFFESGMTFHSFFMLDHAGNSMWGKQQEDETKQGETMNEEANFICEEAIINDKEKFGRARSSLMEYLRAKYGSDIANRSLNRINKRSTMNYFSDLKHR